jgi:DNA-binding NtrC family response regulator
MKQDISLIAMHCVRKLNRKFGRNVRSVAPEALALLTGYDFPGNVRELENILERAYALGADREITLRDLPILCTLPRNTGTQPDGPRRLAELERHLVSETLLAHHNDRAKAAQALGMSERTLYRRLKKHGL